MDFWCGTSNPYFLNPIDAFISSDTFLTPSEERHQLLRWWLTRLDNGLENIDLVEVVKDLGICNSADVTGDNLVTQIFLRILSFQASCLEI